MVVFFSFCKEGKLITWENDKFDRAQSLIRGALIERSVRSCCGRLPLEQAEEIPIDTIYM